MRCKDIQRLIIRASVEEAGEEELARIEEHLRACARCAGLEKAWKKGLGLMKNAPDHRPSEEIMEATRRLCHRELAGGTYSSAERRGLPVPRAVWAALAAIVCLTGLLTLPLAEDIAQGPPFSLPTVSMLALAAQNLVMLFFSPFLLRRFRGRIKDFLDNGEPPGFRRV